MTEYACNNPTCPVIDYKDAAPGCPGCGHRPWDDAFGTAERKRRLLA